jgi:uncharacterized protein (TIGR03435 family)
MKLFCAILALAYALAAQTPRFEVASIKPNHSDSFNSSSRRTAGQLEMTNVSLRKAILMAYGIPDDREYVLIGPSWLATERIDIVAKYPGSTSIDDSRRMLQNLFAERFHLELIAKPGQFRPTRWWRRRVA